MLSFVLFGFIMKYYLLKITYKDVSIELVDKCPSSTYLVTRERKEHCTFKLCNSKKAVIATVMQLALDKATESKCMLQATLTILEQLKESNND